MDNAQKAIMIGVGLFIAIIIISAVLLITNIGTDLINNARNQMSNISKSLQNQVTAAFDGKTVTGAEVIAACQQYENSDSISVMIYATKDNTFKTGKYDAALVSEFKVEDYQEAKAGGVYVKPNGENSAYQELKGTAKSSLTKIQDTANGGVSSTQSYYSYTMKDESTEAVMGVLFVRKGLK